MYIFNKQERQLIDPFKVLIHATASQVLLSLFSPFPSSLNKLLLLRSVGF